jgi:hypothetical protein
MTEMYQNGPSAAARLLPTRPGYVITDMTLHQTGNGRPPSLRRKRVAAAGGSAIACC